MINIIGRLNVVPPKFIIIKLLPHSYNVANGITLHYSSP